MATRAATSNGVINIMHIQNLAVLFYLEEERRALQETVTLIILYMTSNIRDALDVTFTFCSDVFGL